MSFTGNRDKTLHLTVAKSSRGGIKLKRVLPCIAGEYNNFDRVEQNGGSAEGGKDPTSGWFVLPAMQVDYFERCSSNNSDKW